MYIIGMFIVIINSITCEQTIAYMNAITAETAVFWVSVQNSIMVIFTAFRK